MTEPQNKIHAWLVRRLCLLGLNSWATAKDVSSAGGPVYRMTAGGAKRCLAQLVRLELAEERKRSSNSASEYRATIEPSHVGQTKEVANARTKH